MKKWLAFFLLFNLQAKAQIDPRNVTIARDSFGVPHIFAPTDPETAYGLAWAHAEDDFTTLQLVVLSGKAKLGTGIGKKGAEADYVINLLRCRQLVDEQWSTLSPDFIALIKGYVQGLNDYAKKYPGKVKYKKAFPFNEKEYMTAVVFSVAVFCGVDKLYRRYSVEEWRLFPASLRRAPMRLHFIHPKQRQAKRFWRSMPTSH